MRRRQALKTTIGFSESMASQPFVFLASAVSFWISQGTEWTVQNGLEPSAQISASGDHWPKNENRHFVCLAAWMLHAMVSFQAQSSCVFLYRHAASGPSAILSGVEYRDNKKQEDEETQSDSKSTSHFTSKTCLNVLSLQLCNIKFSLSLERALI